MLSLKNISKTYPDGTQALKNISLSFTTGMVGLLGPNGAGKSSLMRTIACLQLPDSGSVKLNDVDVLHAPEIMRSALGYLPQYFGVYPHMSCQALLQHIAVLKGLSGEQQAKQIPELLELTNLSNVANKSVSTFSGGMRQRFGIAQALLGNPSVLIMDEPTAGLDPEEREKLHDMLVSISKEKLVLLSTHIVEDIENLCSQVTLMFDGQIKASDSVPALLKTIENRVWLVDDLPANAHKTQNTQNAIKLSKAFQYGESKFRVYCESQPTENAVATEPSLQDLYFYLLKSSAPVEESATC